MTEYMDTESSSTSTSKNQNSAAASTDSLHPRETLDYYIYDYFVKHKFQETAKAFLQESEIQLPSNRDQNTMEDFVQNNGYNNQQKESFHYDQNLFDAANGKSEHLDSFNMNIPSNANPTSESKKDTTAEANDFSMPLPAPSVAIDIPEGFFVEWFNIFWDVFSARVSRVNSSSHLYDPHFNRSAYRGQNHSSSTPIPSNVPNVQSSSVNPLNYAATELKSSENKPYAPFTSAFPKSDTMTTGNNPKSYALPSRAVPFSGPPSNISLADRSQKYGSALPAGNIPPSVMPYSLGVPPSSVPPNYPNTSMLSASPPRSLVNDPNNHTYAVGPGMNPSSSRNGFYPPTPAQIHQLKSQQEYLHRQSKQMSEPAVDFNPATSKDSQVQSNEQPVVNPASSTVQKKIPDPKALYSTNKPNSTTRSSASPIITQASSGMGGNSSFYPYHNNMREAASMPTFKPSPNMMIQPRYPANSEFGVNDMQKYRPRNSVDGMPPYLPQNPVDLNGKYGMNPNMANRLPSQQAHMPNYYRGQLPMSSHHPQMYESPTANQGSVEFAKTRELAMRRGQTPNMSVLSNDITMSGEASNVNLGNPLTDYHMQLMLLEEQNKKRLMMARKEGERDSLSPETYERYNRELKNSQVKSTTDGASHLHPKPSGGMSSQVKGTDVPTTGYIQPHQKQPSLPVQHSFMNVPQNEHSNIMMSQYLNRSKQHGTAVNARDSRDPNIAKKFPQANTVSMSEKDRMALEVSENSNSWLTQNRENNSSDTKEMSKYQSSFTQPSQPKLPSSTSASGHPNSDSQHFLEPVKDKQGMQKDTARPPDIASNGYPSMNDAVQQISMPSAGTEENVAVSSEEGINANKDLQDNGRIEESASGKTNAGKDAGDVTKDGVFNESTDNTFNYASKNDSNAELLNDFDFESFLNDAGDDSTQVYY
ncbi:transcription factor [Schizosaccharomyces cryophilus OY26]|uniref:Transcription factor n=1 Tax=Schizosaccharomyces cryophilus (strain OY26 / ATCC MYA-4695 / CBS 11777 / NBRC 106824 / NRRL Y48691) TaxID=653667 RepID=S9VVI4_SCHCR|nr:transcription factor [Schizosaccharomyces cryophilus OY26]EPY50115.1 transcription factor [Schizosaccharomyces cryophilus OY26]